MARFAEHARSNEISLRNDRSHQADESIHVFAAGYGAARAAVARLFVAAALTFSLLSAQVQN